MKIMAGNLEVLYSGVVRTEQSNRIEFLFDDIEIEFAFILDGKDYKAEYAAEGGKKLRVNVYNSTSVTGSGIASPMRIGTLEDHEFWMAYRSFKVSSKHESWALEYVFYRGAEVNE